MLIRQLNSNDASALQSLRELADIDATLGNSAERQLALTLEHIEKQLQLPTETFGALIDEILVGSASLSRMEDCPLDPNGVDRFGISTVVVRPEFRRKGVGRSLVCMCLSRAIEHGAKDLLLEVYVPNPARALYESLGFKAWNTYEGAYEHNGQRFDKVSMARRLG